MNNGQSPYIQFQLVQDMMETVDLISQFDPDISLPLIPYFLSTDTAIFTGEGSSRIFPAGIVIHHNRLGGNSLRFETESAAMLPGYPLPETLLVGASNSGKTRELIQLFQQKSHLKRLGITCTPNSILSTVTDETIVIPQSAERSIPATKSVIGQALVYDSILTHLTGRTMDYHQLADEFREVLETSIDDEISNTIAQADTIYFVGRSTGVAEELRLKTNEIIHKRSDYLPGTYLLHGIEEVITSRDVIILVDVPVADTGKIRTHFCEAIGTPVFAISSTPTLFPTIKIPEGTIYTESFLKLAAGWNLLVEAGIKSDVNMDKPDRVRKIGNEYLPENQTV